nr:Chain P, Envelope glycoprotein GP41 [synthetic construct]2F5B_P Chain P, PROTEIN (GP41 EPITOPE) [synthetic construct]
ELDKWAS